MTDIIVFTGPTISATAAAKILPALYLPPVSQGDVFRASRRAPRAIAIIDGYFDRVPAVWHKEILWAMARGIHVFGSASMGALRAAELAPFGMHGMGKIFRAFQDGFLDDDEEVAVAHGDAGTGYRPSSEAMVNVRATLEAAVAAGAISALSRQALEREAKSLFYPARTYAAILAGASGQGVPQAELAAFEGFLPSGRVDQKRRDAEEMLAHLRDRGESLARPQRPSFVFEHTDTWDQAMVTAGEGAEPMSGAEPLADRLDEELRLRPELETVRRGAMLRAIAAEETRRQGLIVDQPLLDSIRESFGRKHGLHGDEAVRTHLAAQGVGEAELAGFLDGEARLSWLEAMYEQDALNHQRAEMVSRGILPSLRSRADRKQSVLTAAGLAEPEPGDCPLEGDALLRWYFEQCLGREMPADGDAFLRAHGLPDEAALRREARREFLYLRLTASDT